MNLMEIHEVDPEEYLVEEFDYPVYVHLKGKDLYIDRITGSYSRKNFHEHPENYRCLFKKYISETDILINGVYWEQRIERLFEMQDLSKDDFRIKTIADISDDRYGSVPCNIMDGTIENPVYGVDKKKGIVTDPYLPESVDVIAIGNLPNELPRDASRYFGEQLIKYILNDLITGGSKIIQDATIVQQGNLTSNYQYMKDYAGL